MHSVEYFIKKIREERNYGNYQQCIGLCKKAIPLTNKSEFNDWYWIRFNLSRFLKKENQIEEAIHLSKDLLRNLNKENKPEEWAMTNLSLGALFIKRIEGDKNKNLDKAITFYEHSLAFFTKDEYPSQWAGIKSKIGYLLVEIESKDYINNLIKATKYLKETLSYYTKKNQPVDYKDILKELSRLKKILNNNNVWLEIWKGYKDYKQLEIDLDVAWKKLCEEQGIDPVAAGLELKK